MAQDDDDTRAPADWIVTYGDMMSLLLTFFILLVSMAEMKQQKYEMLVESLRRSFGNNATQVSPMANPSWLQQIGLSKLRSKGKAKRSEVLKGGEPIPTPRGDHPRTLTIRAGRNPTLGAVIYFDEASGELTPANREILEKAASLLRGKPQKVEIRGHTSAYPLPADSPYKNRWDLAYARCIHTMECLSESGVDRKRIRVSVAAENEPLHRSVDPLLRKENSRVEVFMLDEFVEDLNEPKTGKL